MFLVDGFNLWHALDIEEQFQHLKWLDLAKLARCFVSSKQTIEGILYFTALAAWSPQKMERHKTYIRALRLRGVRTVYGQFRKRDVKCRARCRQWYKKYEEKQTDVNIAVHLFEMAYHDKYDLAFIVSGDSDLIPAIDRIRETFPEKRFGVVIPIGRRAEELKQRTDLHRKMKRKHLESSRLPDIIDLGEGKVLRCPSNWAKEG